MVLRLPLVLICLAPCLASAPVSAQARQPAAYVALFSAGLPLRVTVDDDLGQDRLAPAFFSVLGGYVPASARSFRHGGGLGISWNTGRDGGYVTPIYALDQLVLMPAYLGAFELADELPALAHAGVPVLLAGGRSFGLEVGCAVAHFLLAGTGVFARLDIDAFVGGQKSLHVLAAVELGVLLRYEVLP